MPSDSHTSDPVLGPDSLDKIYEDLNNLTVTFRFTREDYDRLLARAKTVGLSHYDMRPIHREAARKGWVSTLDLYPTVGRTGRSVGYKPPHG